MPMKRTKTKAEERRQKSQKPIPSIDQTPCKGPKKAKNPETFLSSLYCCWEANSGTEPAKMYRCKEWRLQ